MKHLIVIIVFFIIKLNINAQWFVESTGTTKNNNTVFFVDTSYGWIGSENTIFKSTDGGESWSSSIVEGSCKSIYFKNSNFGFCATNWQHSNPFYYAHHIYRTSDAGTNWQIIHSGEFHLYDIFFVNDLLGFSVGTNYSQGVVLKTTDGGNSWTQISWFSDNQLRSIYMFDENYGFAAGGSSNSAEKIWRTLDGGNNWSEIFSSALPWGVFEQITFADALTGFVLGRSFWKTTDGGISWKNISLTPDTLISTIISRFISISLVSNECWVTLDSWFSDRILYSSDFGENWLPILHQNKSPYLTDVFFVDNQKGWITGSHGLLLKTVDGGFDTIPVFSRPEIYFPINDTIVNFVPVEFHWSPDNFAFYRFQLGKDSLFNSLIFESISLGNLEGNYNFELDQYSDYFWKVRYENYSETGPWSFIGHFYTGELTTSADNNMVLTENELCQNYPNPFNPKTTITYNLRKSGFVQLKVYDILGREVALLVDEEQLTGKYNVEFNGNNLNSGVYFYHLTSGDFTDTKKLILLK